MCWLASACVPLRLPTCPSPWCNSGRARNPIEESLGVLCGMWRCRYCRKYFALIFVYLPCVPAYVFLVGFSLWLPCSDGRIDCSGRNAARDELDQGPDTRETRTCTALSCANNLCPGLFSSLSCNRRASEIKACCTLYENDYSKSTTPSSGPRHSKREGARSRVKNPKQNDGDKPSLT